MPLSRLNISTVFRRHFHFSEVPRPATSSVESRDTTYPPQKSAKPILVRHSFGPTLKATAHK